MKLFRITFMTTDNKWETIEVYSSTSKSAIAYLHTLYQIMHVANVKFVSETEYLV